MKRIISYLLLLLSFCLVSCNDKPVDIDDNNGEKTVSGPKINTLSAEPGPLYVAMLSGSIGGLEGIALDFECGVECSSDENFSKEKTVRKAAYDSYSENPYKVAVADIRPGVKYYYRAYYINQLMIYYGEVKDFTFTWNAPVLSVLPPLLDEEERIYTLMGIVNDLDSIEENIGRYFPKGKRARYGVEYSTSESFEEDKTVVLEPENIIGDTIVCTVPSFEFNVQYYYRVFFKFEEISCISKTESFMYVWNGPDYNGHDYVDLGLSVKWATCNVGASAPEEYGGYYAYGELETKDNYDWTTYKWCEGTWQTITKYKDEKRVLERKDDVAHVMWGGDWRIPSEIECQELLDSCSRESVTVNGIRCLRLNSKIEGYTDKYILLPYTGFCTGTLNENIGSQGWYMTNKLNPRGDEGIWYMAVGSNGSNVYGSMYCNYDRYLGISVRPVCEK